MAKCHPAAVAAVLARSHWKWRSVGDTQTPGSLTTTQNYSLDLQSIFVLGDQFVRGSNAPTMALPDATDFQKAYPLETDIQNLFVDDADDVMADGTATLSITGRQALSTIT